MERVKLIQACFILILSLLGYGVTSGQSDYVVLIKGDTVKGDVKYLNYGVEKKVQVTSTGNKKVVYSILQTRGFSMNNETYHTIRANNTYTYMKLLKAGYLSLYAFQVPNQMTWDGRLFSKKDGTTLEIPNIGFKKAISRFLGDCNVIPGKIESGELSKQNLEAILDEYNTCLNTNSVTTKTEVTPKPEVVEASVAWNDLERAVKSLEDFEGKADALEVITEIRAKIQRKEKIPGFMINGLKDSLKDQNMVKNALDKALAEIQ